MNHWAGTGKDLWPAGRARDLRGASISVQELGLFAPNYDLAVSGWRRSSREVDVDAGGQMNELADLKLAIRGSRTLPLESPHLSVLKYWKPWGSLCA